MDISAVRSQALPLLKTTWQDFQRHQSSWLAAAIAYYTMFAVAPLIIVLVEIAGLILGQHHNALHAIYGYLQKDAGAGGAKAVQSMVTATFAEKRSGIIAEIIGWIVFIMAAIGLFSSLQQALNTVWDVKPKNQGWKATVRQRLWSFVVVLGIALLLLVSIGINAGLTVMSAALTHVFPGFATLMKVADFIVSWAFIAAAFALLYEFLPERRIEWRDVGIGAAFSSFLFVVGQFLLGWYLGRAGIASGYGVFGSLVVFLLWVNYSAQILLFGAEFTHVYAQRYGSAMKGSRGEVAGAAGGRPAAASNST